MKRVISLTADDAYLLNKTLNRCIEAIGRKFAEAIRPLESAVVSIQKNQLITSTHLIHCHQLLGFAATLVAFQNEQLEEDFVWLSKFCARHIYAADE
jgi:hypothetical protein